MSRIGAEPKPPWRLVPAAVRGRVAEATGGHVARAIRVWGGYAPSPTFRLFLVDGRRVFFKGVNRDSNEHMHRALEAEERAYRELEPWLAPWAPTLRGSFTEADWHVLLLEDLGPATVPPWSAASVKNAMAGYAAFHGQSLGQDLPEWLSTKPHHSFARRWAELCDEPGGLDGMLALAGARAGEARVWAAAAIEPLRGSAEKLLDVEPPYALLHLDTRSDNLRLQPGGRLRVFDWPYAAMGPPELDLAAFSQTITCEGGPDADEVVAAYARWLPVRESVLDAAVAATAGYFAHHAWREPIPGLPRVRAVQQAQLKTSLAWAARRLELPAPEWLAAL